VTDFATQSHADFERAHNRAFINKVLALLLGRAAEKRLLSFEAVREKLRWEDESYIGLRTVPLKAIVGSVGRYRDFDREFLPVQRATRTRWRRIDEAHYNEVGLPPVQLYKVGEVYFVKDGNHRVSVARERGAEFIDAEVTECRSCVPLTPDVTVEDLARLGEHADFLDWSKLDELRPDQDVRLTIPSGFGRLREHIAVHHYYMAEKAGKPVPRADAVAHWYDTVYMPVVRLIREDDVLRKFPGRTEADLYLWIMDHLYFLKERDGEAVGVEDATEDFAEHYGQRSVFDAIRQHIAALTQDEGDTHEPAP
jgi:hypothetical protein